MRRSITFLGFISLFAGLTVTVLWQQRQTGVILRLRADHGRNQQRDHARLSADNECLRLAQPLPAEMEALRKDHVALQGLRAEVETARSRVQSTASEASVKRESASATGPKTSEPSITTDSVPVAFWKNAGSATPVAAAETILWAAAGGNVELLAQNLLLTGDVKAKAAALWAELPPATRLRFDSPETLIATLVAKDIPLVEARVSDPKVEEADGVKLVMQLRDAEKKTKFVWLTLRQEGATWKVVVPESAIEKYAASLRAQPAGVSK